MKRGHFLNPSARALQQRKQPGPAPREEPRPAVNGQPKGGKFRLIKRLTRAISAGRCISDSGPCPGHAPMKAPRIFLWAISLVLVATSGSLWSYTQGNLQTASDGTIETIRWRRPCRRRRRRSGSRPTRRARSPFIASPRPPRTGALRWSRAFRSRRRACGRIPP